ncbi:MAG TPA: hypothetical protein VN367_09100 [Chlorobaculum sp.]|nr:hypothetical protein [Chlorobaculum sp.]
MGEGETPIAFFDGVFYESHQERVGNIVYQDYLVYTDKAIYLWARGSTKDYLDRFNLGAVSVNSRNKDSAFATLNLKIRREEKEPVYVIFDMVEIREADTIVKLHTVVESTIEDYLGVNYRQEIPQDTATRILQAARKYCPPRSLSIPLEAPQVPISDAGIGYGQDLLEQYKASIGYSLDQDPQQQARAASGARQPGGPGPQDAIRGGIESLLPTDPASLKRIADQIKNLVGDAPFKLRDQVMKDLQHVPGDVATVLTALNELLSNIAGNPLAERFVMNAIKTAVVNDGVLGSLTKIIKLTSGGGKKPAKPAGAPSQEDHASDRAGSPGMQDDTDSDDTTIRRKKISVRDDEPRSPFDPFEDNGDVISSRENRPQNSRPRPAMDDDSDADSGGQRKKIAIKMDDDDGSNGNEIARKLMSYDESEREQPIGSIQDSIANAPAEPETADSGIRKKKLSIKAEAGSGAEADIARKLMSYDEAARHADNPGLSSGINESRAEETPEPQEIQEPRRKKIQIKAEEPEAEEFSIPEDIVFSAMGEIAVDERPDASEYMTIESDDSISKSNTEKEPERPRLPIVNIGLGIQAESVAHKKGLKDGGDDPEVDKHSVTVKITP